MNKGFTLAELMGVIVILAILSIIVTTAIDRNITESRASTCQTQEKNIIEATKMYVTDDASRLPTSAGNNTKITIKELIDEGYLDEDMENPMTGKLYKDSGTDIYVEISITSNSEGIANKDYTYTVKYKNDEEACQ